MKLFYHVILKTCKYWNKLIDSSKEIWLHQFWKVGGQMMNPPTITTVEAQKLYWHQHYYKENFNEDLYKGQFLFGPYDEEDTTECYKLKSPYFCTPYLAVGMYFTSCIH